ncbi:hypothetical protein N7532_002040 [Penicillium argentinense]|uniref:N-acetyltransferase domain-containing protein n=1 Tax=Penicillium argentinense TaxID=1131581 RepID=A0A9W9G3L0_9EURO|nr:uncharacterized protein N7532_002040 [Penicillium argentinense]KAJ5111505.1 hypothetical protein N7532_002040 [Penicillium argentinense]
MTTPEFSMLPVEGDDLPFPARFIHAAKLRLSINRLLFENWPKDQIQTKACFKAVNTSSEILVYYVIARKRPLEAQPEYGLKNGPNQETPEGLNPILFAKVMKTSGDVMGGVENLDCFEIVYMCVKPSAQRHGIGSKLMQLGFDRAKAEDVPLRLCAEAPAHGFYVKLGLEETKHADIDLRKYAAPYSGFGEFRLTGMIWRPKPNLEGSNWRGATKFIPREGSDLENLSWPRQVERCLEAVFGNLTDTFQRLWIEFI